MRLLPPAVDRVRASNCLPSGTRRFDHWEALMFLAGLGEAPTKRAGGPILASALPSASRSWAATGRCAAASTRPGR
jgi:hypothetical protein